MILHWVKLRSHVTSARQLSMQPAAVRKRKQRERARLSLVPPAPATVGDASSGRTHNGSASPAPRVTLRETAPVTGPGPDAFASIPMLPGANGEASRPFVPPPAEEPKPPPSAADVALIVGAVTWYFELGTQAMFLRHPELLELFPPQLVGEHYPKVKELVRGATERVAIKYSVRVPYGDELVVVGAIGLATFGLVGGDTKKPPANQNGRVVDTHARERHKANAPAPEKREPRPVTSDDDTERDVTLDSRAQRAAAGDSTSDDEVVL